MYLLYPNSHFFRIILSDYLDFIRIAEYEPQTGAMKMKPGKLTAKYTSNAVAILLFLSIATFSAYSQTLKADYQFQGNLLSSVAGAPAMSQIGGLNTYENDRVDGYARQTMRFPANGGLSVNTTSLISSTAYTVVILFRFDAIAGARRRVFDAKQGLSNPCGLYYSNSRLEPEPSTVTLIHPNTFVQVVISRDTNGAMRVARDGFLITLAGDSCYSNTDNNLRFFADDSVVGNEVSAGNVARIRLYDGSMTPAQIRALDRPANANGGGDQKILFTTTRHNQPEIYSMNSDGTNERRLTNNTVADFGARWSPDKSKIVFTRLNANIEQLWTMNADGSGETQITNTAFNDHAASYKPDGSKIVFSRCDNTFLCSIYTMNPDGTNQQPFSGAAVPEEDEDFANYSPDGSRIVFSRTNLDPAIPTSGLYSLTETNILTRLTSPALPVGDREARYSPDGTKIAYNRFPDILSNANQNGIELFRMNANGTNQTNFTNNAVFDNLAIWTQDSTRVAFHSRRDLPDVNEIYTMNSSTGGDIVRLTFNSAGDNLTDFHTTPSLFFSAPFDYDGDGKTDVSVWRPADGNWYISQTSNSSMSIKAWGLNGDKIVPADYDGDGKTDVAVRRPSNNTFYILNSATNTVNVTSWGLSGDVPLPADYDGDGKDDIAVWRPSEGNWYIAMSASGNMYVEPWGFATDIPTPGDYTGDGRTELGVFRPSEGKWYSFNTLNRNISISTWGLSGDVPVPADYSGDGRTDLAVYRPSNNTWYRLSSQDGTIGITSWGLPSDVPTPGDYDGDGRNDLAVFRPSNSTWYVLTANSSIRTQTFGLAGDTPTPSAFVF